MLGRRAIVFIGLLLAIGVLASLFSSTSQNPTTTTTTGTTTTADAPGQTTATAPDATAPTAPTRVTAVLPSPRGTPITVRATVGQTIDLTVNAPAPDSVSIDGLDQIDQAQPGTPARFSLIVTRPGSYPVHLLEARRKVGELRIAAKQP